MRFMVLLSYWKERVRNAKYGRNPGQNSNFCEGINRLTTVIPTSMKEIVWVGFTEKGIAQVKTWVGFSYDAPQS